MIPGIIRYMTTVMIGFLAIHAGFLVVFALQKIPVMKAMATPSSGAAVWIWLSIGWGLLWRSAFRKSDLVVTSHVKRELRRHPSTRQFMEIDQLTEHGLKTAKGGLVFYLAGPDDLSVRSASGRPRPGAGPDAGPILQMLSENGILNIVFLAPGGGERSSPAISSAAVYGAFPGGGGGQGSCFT